ncbi:MAG: arsenate reductase (glutaredoxin) [Gammaproteobacteria bacterium]|nr:arsenate reductase (glutaredoxin) [Gammaproteobacteria bacterium]
MDVTLYHNPRCSKSRQALELLRKYGIEPTIVEYLKDPPGQKRLKELLDRLGMEPRDLMRKKESAYRDLRLDDPGLSRDQLIAALAEHPVLIERPIVVTDLGAVVGRPPEKVLDIL